MPNLISLGTSASKGLGLHLYNRDTITNDGIIDLCVSRQEYEFNLKNSYSGILADTLQYTLHHIDTGYRYSFFSQIDSLIKSLETDRDTKIVILQLSNLHRDFFIYDNTSYELDFETYEGFIKSKEKLIEGKDEHFIKELESDIQLFLLNENVWRSKQITKMILKIEELRVCLEKHNIIFKVLHYFDDWKIASDYFSRHRLVCLIHTTQNHRYEFLYDFVKNEKLTIADDIEECTDQHPNFQAHKIIAQELHSNIKAHPLYHTL